MANPSENCTRGNSFGTDAGVSTTPPRSPDHEKSVDGVENSMLYTLPETNILLEEIRRENQLRLVVYPIMYRVFLHPRISSINSIPM